MIHRRLNFHGVMSYQSVAADRVHDGDDDVEDHQLARQAQRGSRRAAGALIERHYDAIFGYLYRLSGGDRARAEDWTQETFLRALRSLATYDPQRAFTTWLYAIATNIVRDHAASADARRVSTAPDDADDRWDADDPPLDASLIADADARAVAEALASLTDTQREAVVLVYYQGVSLREAADALGIPLGTVKSRLWYAIARLRQAMETHESTQGAKR